MLIQTDEYRRYLLEVKKSSTNTIESYLRDIKIFNDFLLKKQFKTITEIDHNCILEYIEFLKSLSKADTTILRNVAAIKSYFTFIYLRGKVNLNPTDNIKLSKKVKSISGILSEDEISRLLKAPDTTNRKGIRDSAMLEILYATGIRVSELINLNLENVNLSAGFIVSKGETDRIIPIHNEAIKALNNYIQNSRSLLNIEKNNALFLNLNGKRISRQGFCKLLKKYAVDANISKDVNPYIIRHSFATHLIQNGASLKDVSEMLGHSYSSTINIYAHLINDNVKKSYKKFHPKSL
ncbi:MAG: tyrosine-type recombinase/integrase [Clostridia bacterium]